MTCGVTASGYRPVMDGIRAGRVWDYHEPSDTPETLDYERIADLVAATAGTLARLTPP